MVRPGSSADPAGASPAQGGGGTPGSRPQPAGEIPPGRAGRRKPRRWEQERGPQHEVNPAASSDSQRESRAGHVAAKATSPARSSGATGAGGLLGVEGAARAQGSAGNRRDPSAQPLSRQGRPYKPKAKLRGAQRESEGVVVPSMAAQNNAAGGKGPCFGCAVGSGRREGMTETTRSNHPGGPWADDKAPCRSKQLWAPAERQASRPRPAGSAEGVTSLGAAGRRLGRRRACRAVKTIGKPCAGKPHARFERRWLETGRL